MSISKTLHQLLSDDPRAVEDCLAFIKAGDKVLLADNGVVLLAGRNELFVNACQSELNIGIAAVSSDLAARGLMPTATSGEPLACELLDDKQWVEQVCSYDIVMSWK